LGEEGKVETNDIGPEENLRKLFVIHGPFGTLIVDTADSIKLTLDQFYYPRNF